MTTAPTPVPRRPSSHRSQLILLVVLIVLSATAVVLLARANWGAETVSSGLRGSGTVATETRSVGPFTAIDLTGSNSVTVRLGPERVVVVEADDNLLDRVTTDVRSGTLVVGTQGSFTTDHPMTVDVTVQALDAVTLTGSGLLVVDGVDTEMLTVQVPGSGLVRISGTAERLDAGLAGSGDVQLEDLLAHKVAATLSGSGRLQVNATDSLDASVSGTGAIFYGGNPSRVTKNVTGTGVILGR